MKNRERLIRFFSFTFIWFLFLYTAGCIKNSEESTPPPITEVTTSETSVTDSPKPPETDTSEPTVFTPTETPETTTPKPTVSTPTETPETATPEPTNSTFLKLIEYQEGIFYDINPPYLRMKPYIFSFAEMEEMVIRYYFAFKESSFEEVVDQSKNIHSSNETYIYSNNFHIFVNSQNDQGGDDSEEGLFLFKMQSIQGLPKEFDIRDIQRIIVYAEIEPFISVENGISNFIGSQMFFGLNCAPSDMVSYPAKFYIGNLKNYSSYYTVQKGNTNFKSEMDNSNWKMAYVLIIDLISSKDENGEIYNPIFLYEYPLLKYDNEGKFEITNSVDSFEILKDAIRVQQRSGDFRVGFPQWDEQFKCRIDPENPNFILGGVGRLNTGINVLFKYLIFETKGPIENVVYSFYDYSTIGHNKFFSIHRENQFTK